MIDALWWIYCSQRAESVLKQAQELVKSLDEADDAQQKAKDAIKQANEDISLARDDLEKVFKQTKVGWEIILLLSRFSFYKRL